MYKYIEESPILWNHIHARRALDNGGTRAYCRHCHGDILFKRTGYTSWSEVEEDGQTSISSGVISLIDTCPHCGKLNNPYDKVYLQAYKKGKPQDDYYLTADCFFAKMNYDDFKEEYDKEGELVFSDGEEILV